ncbi:MAG: hypothetical protein BYD32DRAFT_433167 [Podila humilis]|nr:MAG: hypothetical protein BYD32DRAFT_433167 [Podila humilis]
MFSKSTSTSWGTILNIRSSKSASSGKCRRVPRETWAQRSATISPRGAFTCATLTSHAATEKRVSSEKSISRLTPLLLLHKLDFGPLVRIGFTKRTLEECASQLRGGASIGKKRSRPPTHPDKRLLGSYSCSSRSFISSVHNGRRAERMYFLSSMWELYESVATTRQTMLRRIARELEGTGIERLGEDV